MTGIVFVLQMRLIWLAGSQGTRLYFDLLKLQFNFNLAGNFNGATILLNYNNFNKFDEAVFKPLLTESTVKIEIFESKIPRSLFSLSQFIDFLKCLY